MFGLTAQARFRVDSLSQSQSRGEVYQARKAGVLTDDKVLELGQVLDNPQLGRTNDVQITVADLTGVAVQDLMISQAVFERNRNAEL